MPIVKNYMRKDISTIDSGSSATEASKIMSVNKVGYLIVLERGKPVGIVTERDLVLKVMAKESNPKEVKISGFMSSPLITIDPDSHIEEAVEIMKKHGFRRLPVVKNNIIYGIFTAKDLVEHYEELEYKLASEFVRLIPW